MEEDERIFEHTVNFTKEDIKEYLDDMIRLWREKRDGKDKDLSKVAIYYIDAYQSVRVSIFGKLLK